MSDYRRDKIIPEAMRFIEASDHGYTPELVADFFLSHPLTVAYENLRETVGMWCECCPVEVQRALHAIPDIHIHHDDHPFEEPDARMERLRAPGRNRRENENLQT